MTNKVVALSGWMRTCSLFILCLGNIVHVLPAPSHAVSAFSVPSRSKRAEGSDEYTMFVSENRAIVGRWEDHSTGRISLLVPAVWGYVIIAWAGVWLSLSIKYLKKILGNIFLAVHLKSNIPSYESTNRTAATETTPLNPEARNAAIRKAEPLAKVYKDTDGVRDLWWEWFQNKDLTWGFWLCLSIANISITLASLGVIVGGIYSAELRTTGPAKLASQECGLWLFDRDQAGDEAATRAGIIDLGKETRAAEYAANCYGELSAFDAARCDFFYNRRLSFSSPHYTNDCPFANQICRQNQTVAFDTAITDANKIGINSKIAPKFRRNTKCTPLSMEYPYIQNKTENGTTTYYYYYGEKPGKDSGTNFTYVTEGDPWDRLAPVYDVFTYVSESEDESSPHWIPHPDLTHSRYSTVTILFVSSLRILYKQRSEDPIFPADLPVYLPGYKMPWFRNSDPRARPLACINSIDVCLANGTCRPYRAPDDVDPVFSMSPELALLYTSLYKTDIFDSIAKRLGRGLLAQQLVSEYFSEGLSDGSGRDDSQWVKEVGNLVATSHARTQINAWSVASGEDSVHEGKDGYTSVTEGYGNLCEMFKFNPQGYASIHFAAFVIIWISTPIVWILSWDWHPIKTKLKQGVNMAEDMSSYVLTKLRAWSTRRRQGTEQPATLRSSGSGPNTIPTSPTDRGLAAETTQSGETNSTPAEEMVEPPQAESSSAGAVRSRSTPAVRHPSERGSTVADEENEGSVTLDSPYTIWEPVLITAPLKFWMRSLYRR
ncbi:hypothetical protein EJ04DRAFT_572940 [Polyplosphaeria fusca]|uniref:Uncharacterized protein n=1 Tax=Polyplosphaeria fusca TaxID=682080 RepID=A0A9P4R4V3_9PLEO|nr:hypothetical protein EJ04DRAFT_572940 [Polyplosphaeria fusca]